MKNFTLLAVASLLATTTVFAQPKHDVSFSDARLLVRPMTQRQRPVAQRQMAKSHPVKAAAARKAPEGAIVTPPDGKVYENMVVTYEGYAYSFFGISYVSTDAGYLTLVEAEDGALYIQNLTPNLSDDELYWIKAEKVDDKGNYVIHKQPAGYYASYDIVDYITRLEYYEDDEGAYYYEAKNTDIPLTWKDGVLSTPEEFNGDIIFGTVYEYAGEIDWNGDGYYNFNAVPLTDTYTVPSEDALAETFVVKHLDAGEPAVQGVKVVFDGADVYLKLYDNAPGWVKGQVSGNQITVKGGQYMGISSEYGTHEYAHLAKSELAYYEDEEYPEYNFYYDEFTEMLDEDVLTFDPATRTITSANAITIDGSKSDFNSAASFVQPVIYPFVEVPAVPADPDVTYFYNFDEEYGYGITDFNIPVQDINGEYINPEKLSYLVYVDDEVFEFEADEYELEASLTEIPYTYDDGGAISTYYGDKEIAFFFSLAKNVGVQSIYRGCGEEHRSNIVLFDIESEETSVIEVDDPLRNSVRAIATKSVAAEANYDITGRRVATNAKGLLIKAVTFADGSRKSYKVVRR